MGIRDALCNEKYYSLKSMLLGSGFYADSEYCMRFARKCICASRVSQIRPGFLTTFTDVKI
jgi:hypothetical protein